MPKGGALTFTVAGEPNARSLKILASKEADPFLTIPLSSAEVRDVLDELRVELDEIHDIAGNMLDLSPERSIKTIDRLLYFSLGVGYGLLSGYSGPLFEKARVRAYGAFKPSVTPRIVEVTAPVDFIYPFELLQWRDPPPDLTDPILRVRALMGMSAIIRRQFARVQEGPPKNLEDSSKLLVTVFRNASLKATMREVDYFDRVDKIVEVHGPWPGDHQLPELAAAGHIANTCIGVDGNRRPRPAAVVHLACHCNTMVDIANRHYLDIGGFNGKIRLGDLKKQFMTEEGSASPKPRPLVFLNACGSAAPHMADRSSFTAFLLEKEFLGVVGTLCDISDEVAAHFAMVFYEALLGGKTVGEAMYAARWHLMERHRNPLGLLYTYYGDPDLRFSRSHAGMVEPACEAPRLPA